MRRGSRVRSVLGISINAEEGDMLKGRLIRRTLAGCVAIAVAGLPSTAQAMINGGRGGPTPTASPAIVSGQSIQQTGAGAQSGFQWGDAGIGAAGTVVLLGAAAAGSGLARRRRAHRAVVG
jgi:hypothetical protein